MAIRSTYRCVGKCDISSQIAAFLVDGSWWTRYPSAQPTTQVSTQNRKERKKNLNRGSFISHVFFLPPYDVVVSPFLHFYYPPKSEKNTKVDIELLGQSETGRPSGAGGVIFMSFECSEPVGNCPTLGKRVHQPLTPRRLVSLSHRHRYNPCRKSNDRLSHPDASTIHLEYHHHHQIEMYRERLWYRIA